MCWLLLLLLASPVSAQTVVATRTIRAQTVLTAADVAIAPGVMAGALASPEQAIGLEARVVLYAGRPIRAGDIGPPRLSSVTSRSPCAMTPAPCRLLPKAGR